MLQNEIINRDISSSVIKDFTKPSFNTRKNTYTKSIIKGGLDNIDFISVHFAIRNKNGKRSELITYFGDMKNITEKLYGYEKSLNIHDYDYTYVKLNHYMTKSICEFICQKMRRPDAARNYDRNIDRDFFRYNTKTEEKIKVYNQSGCELKYFFYSPKKFENAGDYFNKILIDKLYYCANKSVKDYEDPDIALCGSILTHPMLKNSKYIVGCGFQNSKLPTNNNPYSYLAVRGRLSMNRLYENDINPENVKFVDPGLMVSMIYDLKDISKKYKIGIIPHYIDEDIIRERYGNYKIISMKTTDVLSVCRQIKECEVILSSSLHGIIFSHSLGIPAYHIELNPLQEKDNFKFKDYYSSYDRKIHYENFKCNDFAIPFDRILEYDRNNRGICNPYENEITNKQNDFLSVLPYKNYLNRKFIINDMTDNNELIYQRKVIKKSRIEQLRDAIRKGNVIKVLTDNGYVWKIVK